MLMSVPDFRHTIMLYMSTVQVNKNAERINKFISGKTSKATSPAGAGEVIDDLINFDFLGEDFFERLRKLEEESDDEP